MESALPRPLETDLPQEWKAPVTLRPGMRPSVQRRQSAQLTDSSPPSFEPESLGWRAGG